MELNSTSSLFYLILNSTIVVKIVLSILILMSILSWSIIIYKTIIFLGFKKQIKRDLEVLKNSKNLATAFKILMSRNNSFIYKMSANIIGELKKIEKLNIKEKSKLASETMEIFINNTINEKLNELSYALSFLATCTNSAPFIGLFGTVWGIMHSFHSIGLQKSAGLSTVAPGIAEALIATACGLAVAIPASIAYNTFIGSLTNIENYLNSYKSLFIANAKKEISIFLDQKLEDKK